MGLFGDLFAKLKGTNVKALNPQDAVERLRSVQETLEKKTEYLEKKIEEQTTIALKNAKTNKKVALAALRRRKRYEKDVQQLDGTVTAIESQADTLAGASLQGEVMAAMETASTALQAVHKQINLDKLEELRDQIADQMDVADEIARLLSEPFPGRSDLDEDDLEEELHAMFEQEEEDELTRQLTAMPETGTLPDVMKPAIPAIVTKGSGEDELREMALWAT